jgi:hypothetical protein
MYIKGASKDEKAPFPQLRRCRVAATELNDPEHGAGISVGRWFRNVNRVATPGHEPNDLYDTTFRLFTLQSPFGMGKTAHAIELLSDNRFVSMDANLRYFRQKYDAILASHDERRDMLASVRGTPYRRVERLFYDYISAQRAEVESMLPRVSALEQRPDELKPN